MLSYPNIYAYIWEYKKGLSFISNRQLRKEGTLRASGLAGIEPTPARPNGAGYARLNLSATAGIIKL